MLNRIDFPTVSHLLSALQTPHEYPGTVILTRSRASVSNPVCAGEAAGRVWCHMRRTFTENAVPSIFVVFSITP